MLCFFIFFFFSSRRRHTRLQGDWSSDVCSSDLLFQRRYELQREVSPISRTRRSAQTRSGRVIQRALAVRPFLHAQLGGAVVIVRSDQGGKSLINLERLSCRAVGLAIHLERTVFAAARPFVALLCLAAMLLPGTAFGQSRETLGEGDSIRITVFQNPDLTTETRISEQGTITFPLIGEVAIAGLTPAGAQARIARQLIEGKFVLKPQVSLNVVRVRSRQVSVLGQVAHPGRYPLDDTSSNLTDLLALAGGISTTGDDNVTVMVTRNGKTAKLDINVPTMYRTGDLSQNVQLENGDAIFVQRAPVFYIYGEVQRAGTYRLEPAMTAMQALSVAGGVTQRGTGRGLKSRRQAPDREIPTIGARPTDPAQPDGRIYVREGLVLRLGPCG